MLSQRFNFEIHIVSAKMGGKQQLMMLISGIGQGVIGTF